MEKIRVSRRAEVDCSTGYLCKSVQFIEEKYHES